MKESTTASGKAADNMLYNILNEESDWGMKGLVEKINFLYQLACYNKPSEKKELKRLSDKAGMRARITDKELEYIVALEKELIG